MAGIPCQPQVEEAAYIKGVYRDVRAYGAIDQFRNRLAGLWSKGQEPGGNQDDAPASRGGSGSTDRLAQNAERTLILGAAGVEHLESRGLRCSLRQAQGPRIRYSAKRAVDRIS